MAPTPPAGREGKVGLDTATRTLASASTTAERGCARLTEVTTSAAARFSDADELVKLRPEDLVPVFLRLALPQIQSAGFIPEAVTQVSVVEARAGRN